MLAEFSCKFCLAGIGLRSVIITLAAPMNGSVQSRMYEHIYTYIYTLPSSVITFAQSVYMFEMHT